MGPITISRSPEGFVGRGILGFYGGLGGSRTRRSPKKRQKTKNKKFENFLFLVFSNFVFFVFRPFLGLQRARDPPNHQKSRGFRVQRIPRELGRL